MVNVHLDEDVRVKFSGAKGFGDAATIIWIQTKALFIPPHIGNMALLGTNIFLLFSMSYGMAMW